MLKQFLKFFRSNDESAATVEHPHVQELELLDRFEGSYLEFLLQEVKPRVSERLRAHPTSDPILEVATSILLELFPALWEAPQGGLRDEWSPRLEPPPPPLPGLDQESTVVEEEEGEVVEGEGLEIISEVSEVSEVDGEGGEEADIDADESAFDGDEQVLEVVEVVEAEAPGGFQSALDDTAEFEPPPPVVGPAGRKRWPASLDDRAVLQGARVLLAVLLDNDRLPLQQQLSVEELIMAADLWMRLVAQETGLNEQVQALARQVEEKFAAGHFSQARLLLQIFPASSETRINNDRQLFYEEMILRMGIRRRKGLAAEAAREIGDALDGMVADDESSIREGLEVLKSRAEAELLVYTREQGDVEEWRGLAQLSELPGVEGYLLAKIPPRRWRAPVAREGAIFEELGAHIVQPMLRDHVIGHLKACYFILRAVGDTGLEPYLDSFFDWSSSFCGVNAVNFLPEIYNRTLGVSEFIDDVFADIYDRHYKEPLAEALSGLDEDGLEASFNQAIDQIAESDLGELAPGQFNFGGFVLDAYLGFKYPEPDFGFKIHRLV